MGNEEVAKNIIDQSYHSHKSIDIFIKEALDAKDLLISEQKEEIERLKESCNERNHAGLELLMMGMAKLPNPELGQNVAFLAYKIQRLEEDRKRLREALEVVRKYFDESSNGATANIELMRRYREEFEALQPKSEGGKE